MFELCTMSTDFHVQPHVSWSLGTPHCFLSNHRALCQVPLLISSFHVLCAFCLSAQAKITFSRKVFFQFSICLGASLWPPWSNLALFVLDGEILWNFLPQTPETHTSVPMPPSRGTRSVAAEPVNILADLDLDGLYVKDLRNLLGRRNLPATGPRSSLIERLNKRCHKVTSFRPPF